MVVLSRTTQRLSSRKPVACERSCLTPVVLSPKLLRAHSTTAPRRWLCAFRSRSGAPPLPLARALRNPVPSRLTASSSNYDDSDDDEAAEMSREEVDVLLRYLTAYIAMLPLLRPIDELAYNPAAEIWRCIARIPPRYRVKLVDRLEPGSIRSLWRYSMFRYVWDQDQTAAAFENYSLLDDFPQEPGQVFTYRGRAEETLLAAREQLEEIDSATFSSAAEASGKLYRLSEERSKVRKRTFKQYFFLHPETGALYGRMVPKRLLGVVPMGLFMPLYGRLDIELTTTPVEADAGADMTLVYEEEAGRKRREVKEGEEEVEGGIGLYKEDLPRWWWPEPALGVGSPFSDAGRDYLRVCGPGVFVGCSYPQGVQDMQREEDFVYFVLVRSDPLPDGDNVLGGEEDAAKL